MRELPPALFITRRPFQAVIHLSPTNISIISYNLLGYDIFFLEVARPDVFQAPGKDFSRDRNLWAVALQQIHTP